MMNDDYTSGIYKPDIPEPKPKFRYVVLKPEAKDIRAIEHEGEVYLNARDICINLQAHAFGYPFTSLSVMNFVKSFILNLLR